MEMHSCRNPPCRMSQFPCCKNMNTYNDIEADSRRGKIGRTKGQSLIEMLIALGIGVILIGGVTALITTNLRSSSDSRTAQSAAALTQEVMEAARSKAEVNWNAFYALGKTSANKYYIASSTLAITAGTESVTLGEYSFTRYFYVENVNRAECGTGSVTTDAVTGAPHDCGVVFLPSDADAIAEDPLTQKVTVVVEWNGESVKQEQVVSRARNGAFRQTDWSGASGDNSVATVPNDRYSTSTAIETTTTPGAIKAAISGGGGTPMVPNMDGAEPNHWAWNDVIGWIDFNYGPGNVGVHNDKLFGYASSSVGLIAFDCATTPNGDMCGGAAGDWKVSNVGATLKGWAYNDVIGWISFDSVTATASFPYGVTIDASGELKGFAWNDVIGWISMNCNQPSAGINTCGTNPPYRVKTSWVSSPNTGSLTSSIFDLGGRVALNSVIWKGLESGGVVRFQIAASTNSTGPWNTSDYKGPDGTSGTTYDTEGPDVSTMLDPKKFSDVRYVRYKIFIESNAARTDSPEVRDIVLNYSI